MLSYCNQSKAQIAKKEIKTNIDILMMFFKLEFFFKLFKNLKKKDPTQRDWRRRKKLKRK